MSPRPQTLSDADLLDGARRAIDRVGVMRLTLGDVAAELRISPGTLVHRFGSKRGLLLDLLRRSVSRSAERFAALRAARGSAYATLLGLADHMARHIPNAEVLAHNLTFLQAHLGDGEFRRLAHAQSRAMRKGILKLIRDAIQAGELADCDADRLARVVQATLNGSLLQWAIERQGELASWLRGNLAAVLGPLVRRPVRRAQR